MKKDRDIQMNKKNINMSEIYGRAHFASARADGADFPITSSPD